MQIDTVLLKVASRCNLNCTYCYIYNLGDDAWERQPKRMDRRTIDRTCDRLGRLANDQGAPFSVVLHGGEPLLIGPVGLKHVLHGLRTSLPGECGLHIQTNGILLTDPIIDLCVQYRVGISISLDGPLENHDRFRVGHQRQGSHAQVLQGIDRLRSRQDSKSLFAGLLCVVDPESDPATIYAFLKTTGAPSLDFLYRDGNFDQLPYGKRSFGSTEYGTWMGKLLLLYLKDSAPPRIRILDDMMRLLLGGRGSKEGSGSEDYGILVIDTDGSINKNDTLKSSSAGADQFATNWSVFVGDIIDVIRSTEFAEYFLSQRPKAPQCLACPELGICGGGMPAHRWSWQNGFANPSIFCADQRSLITLMRSALEAELGAA